MFACLLAGSDVVTNIVSLTILCVLLLSGFMWVYFLERSICKEKEIFKTEEAKENFEIKINRYVIGIMIFFAVIFGVLALLCLILYLAKVPDYLSLEETLGITCSLGICAVIIGIFMVCVKRWRVLVNGEIITYKPTIGKKREFPIEDISKAETRRPPMGENIILKIYINQESKPVLTVNVNSTSGGGQMIKKLEKSGII